MLRRKPPTVSDVSLLSLLWAANGPEADDLLARLVSEQTETAIKGVIRNTLASAAGLIHRPDTCERDAGKIAGTHSQEGD